MTFSERFLVLQKEPLFEMGAFYTPCFYIFCAPCFHLFSTSVLDEPI